MTNPQEVGMSRQNSEEPLVLLLSRALGRYRREIRQELAAEGMADLPRSGSWLVSLLARGSLGPQELARRLGSSKQGLSRLAQSLVERGYATRVPDPRDRRRVSVQLTDRGAAAAGAIRKAVARQDRTLRGRLGATEIDRLRQALAELS